MWNRLWTDASRSARLGLVAGAALIVLATAALATWALHHDEDVLFANLAPADAAALTAELDRMKLPYRLGPDGDAILVDAASVHRTRLKLMGRDIPLHGAIGFELFNSADFGMTEFAQKVNYQRALQGEITRTILSLAEVASARVHIAFAEDGLFKRERGGAKASITLAMKPGRTLANDQVLGIQRLVAAAVAGVDAGAVTIVNEHGQALTQPPPGAGGEPQPAERLVLKRQVEDLLRQKVATLLERSFGSAHVLASVEATLDMDQVRVTKEDITHPSAAPGDAAAGVIVRERESSRDGSAAASPLRDAANAAAGSTQRETDYQVGRRIEQVVSMPGAVQRLHVLALVDLPLLPAQTEQLKAAVAAAVGATRERGDLVVVQSLSGWASAASGAALPVAGTRPVDAEAAAASLRQAAVGSMSTSPPLSSALSSALPLPGSLPSVPAPVEAGGPVGLPAIPMLGAFAGLLLASLAIAGFARRGRRHSQPDRLAMTAQQRALALAKVQAWLDEAALSYGSSGTAAATVPATVPADTTASRGQRP